MVVNSINWQQYFMAQAILASKRSKDPSTQVGAVIVTPDNRIIGAGWNGMPKTKPGWDNDWSFPWRKDSKDPLENKYVYVVHAEPNAIIHASENVCGCTMYLTWFPCSDCAKTIAQSGIKKLVYLKENATERYKTSMEGAKKIFQVTGVDCEEYSGDKNSLLIEF
jgi:dCMP deaminase